MTEPEKQIRLAARMYEMRDAARRIAGDSYPKRMAEWKGCLSAIAAKLGVGPIQAVPMIAKGNPLHCGDVEIMWLTAAAVELTESPLD